MKKNENLFNYTLSIGFVFLIVIFLLSIIWITKYSLSDNNLVTEHVTNTKNLIEDINEVEKSVEEQTSHTFDDEDMSNLNISQIKYSNIEKEIEDISILNMKSGTGIITLTFNSKVKQYDDFYYLETTPTTILEEKDNIIYVEETLTQAGKIMKINEDIQENTTTYSVLNIETKKIKPILKENIFGKIILKHGN